VSPLPQVVMVTVDPKRDDVKRMHDYLEGFNPSFIGAVGSNEQIKSITTEFGIAYEKIKSLDGKAGEYDMQHSGAVILISPQGKLTAFFNWPHQASNLVEDYKHLVS
jgi:protein SCO1